MEMTISGLRERLQEADEKQLSELICQIYKHSEVAQQIVDSTLLDDDYGMRFAETTKKKLERAFFSHGKIDRSLTQAKELLRQFRMRTRFPRHLWRIRWRDERITDYELRFSGSADFRRWFGTFFPPLFC